MTSQEQLLGQAGHRPGGAVAALVDSGARRLRDAVGRVLYQWQAERARAELRALSDRTLADIGLTRAQIESLFR